MVRLAFVRPAKGAPPTSQGHPRTVFRRALAHGNLLLAEDTAREVGRIDLREALELTALIAKHERRRLPRVGAPWLQPWLGEAHAPTLEDATLVVGCLGALGGPLHDHALVALRDVARRESMGRGARSSVT